MTYIFFFVLKRYKHSFEYICRKIHLYNTDQGKFLIKYQTNCKEDKCTYS